PASIVAPASPVPLATAAAAALLLALLLLLLAAPRLPHAAVRLDVDLLTPQVGLDLFRLLDRPLAHDQLLPHLRALLDDQLLLGDRNADLFLLDLAAAAPHGPPLDLHLFDPPRHGAPHVLRAHVLLEVHLARLDLALADGQLLLGPRHVRLATLRPFTARAEEALRTVARMAEPLLPRRPAREHRVDPVLRLPPQRQPLERRQP